MLNHRLREFLPLLIAASVLGLMAAAILYKALARTEGHLIYALDDPYIHMAMAKNFARAGVWGITRHEFSSATSAPLWTLSLATSYFVFGVNEIAPLVLALASALAVLGAAFWICAREHLAPLMTTLVLCGLIIVTPLPTLIFVGQEHALHLCLTLLVAYLAAQRARQPETLPLRRWRHALYVLIPLLVMTRYEGVFLVAGIVGLFLARKRWRAALLLLALGLLPILLYGALSVANGWKWLPNSILLKSAPPAHLDAFVQTTVQRLETVPALGGMFVVASAALFFAARARALRVAHFFLFLFLTTTALHLVFARVGWFHRYEAYLIGWGWISGCLAVLELTARLRRTSPRPQAALFFAMTALLVATSIALGQRAFDATRFIPQATQNIYEQQYQMGKFARAYYNDAVIAANDVGALAFLSDARVLDVTGLATRETAWRQLAGERLVDAGLDAYMQREGAQIAMLYDSLFTQEGQILLPASWTRMARWTIQNPIVVGDTTVSLYAVTITERAAFARHLGAFAPTLPRGVWQEGAPPR